MDIIRQLSLGVDNRSGRLTVWRHPPAGEHLPHCTPYQDSFSLSPAVVVARGEGFGYFRLDTGARYSLVAESTLAHFVAQKSATPLSGAGPSAAVNGVPQARDYMLNELMFDGQAIGQLAVSEGMADMRGLNFLGRFDRYMSAPSTLEFRYEASHFTADKPRPLRRLPVRFVNGHVALLSSASDHPARCGLQNDDVLVEINGKRVEPATIADASAPCTDAGARPRRRADRRSAAGSPAGLAWLATRGREGHEGRAKNRKTRQFFECAGRGTSLVLPHRPHPVRDTRYAMRNALGARVAKPKRGDAAGARNCWQSAPRRHGRAPSDVRA